ncbi:hypothetical protein KY334_05845 [Candidatus Woesearchaeota archaeon]|nr:hypothetical protein [Candidatus Woesearchaeota archaeon]
MKQYPSIDRTISSSLDIYAFNKLDGSNIRVEWTRKNGFEKFGSRRQLIDERTPILGESIQIFNFLYKDQLHEIFKENRWQKVTCFLEFHGDNSFAGTHQNEQHRLTLFDVQIHKKGFLLPREFLKTFKDVKTAKLLYTGKCNQPFIESVENGTLEGMTFEGVVCKANKYKTPGVPYMFKVKNKEWIEKLKIKCEGNEKLFKELL